MSETTLSRPPEGAAGSRIPLEEAIKRIQLFRETYVRKAPTVPEEIRGNAFSRELMLAILQQPGCDGIRIYHSVREDAGAAVRELVVVGIDKNGDDLVTVHGDGGDGKTKRGCNPLGIFLALPASPPPGGQAGIVAANPRPCPHMCGSSPSPLNS